MKKVILILVVTTMLILTGCICGCGTPTHNYTIQITYIDGTSETLMYKYSDFEPRLDNGCIYHIPDEYDRCGVRKVKILSKTEITKPK
jgi:hypothetical protein